MKTSMFSLAVTLMVFAQTALAQTKPPVTSVPEPGVMGLMALGAGAAYVARRFKK